MSRRSAEPIQDEIWLSGQDTFATSSKHNVAFAAFSTGLLYKEV